MADNNSIVQLAVDAYHGEVGKYSNKDSNKEKEGVSRELQTIK